MVGSVVMSRVLAASSVPLENSADELHEQGPESAPVQSSASVSLLSNWTPVARNTRSRRELAAIVFVSVLVHGGIAAAAYVERDAPREPKRISRVEIQMSRPAVVKKAVTPPPPEPPKPPKPQQLKSPAPLPKNELAPVPTAPVDAPAPEAPIDTGSSLPAAEDGELFAGSGGLGTAAPTPPPPPPVQAPPAPAPVTQAREGANYLKNPRPAYPGRARREGWEGTTVLRVQVSPSGKPGAIQVQKSSGRQVLDDAAADAVKRWTFTPASQGGKAISGWVTVPIVFKLQ